MWFDLAVLWGSSKLIWSRLRSHIPPQQTTGRARSDTLALMFLPYSPNVVEKGILRSSYPGCSMLIGQLLTD